MKTAIKVINIITIVGAAISFIVCLFIGGLLEVTAAQLEAEMGQAGVPADQLNDAEIMLAFLNFMISLYDLMFLLLPASIGVGIAGLVVLSKAKSKTPVTVMGILTIIFTNVLSGIFMLVLPKSAFGGECACSECACSTEPQAPAEATDVFETTEATETTEENKD